MLHGNQVTLPGLGNKMQLKLQLKDEKHYSYNRWTLSLVEKVLKGEVTLFTFHEKPDPDGGEGPFQEGGARRTNLTDAAGE